jgi:hypothetical protein
VSVSIAGGEGGDGEGDLEEEDRGEEASTAGRGLGLEHSWGLTYAEIFSCQIGSFPIKYLGVPVSPSRLECL